MRKTESASLIVVFSLTVAILCSGCTSPTTSSSSPTIAVKNVTVQGAGITVMQGQNFTIQLQSNLSSGYRWEPTYDNSSILFVNHAFLASNISPSGESGADVFTFQGAKQGTSVITFNNINPANQTINSVNYTVTCTSSNVTQGNAVLVSQGQNFTLRLQSNPSTGYRWEPIYDDSSLGFINRAFVSNVSTRSVPIVGAGGTDLFTFQATKQGTTVVIFNNVSPANQTTNSLSYTVVIR